MKDNLIQRMEFQIQIDQASHFDLLAKEIPALVSENLEDYIEQTIDELELGAQFLIIERLVLDLGRLDISNLKNEIKDKFKFHFLEELKKQLGQSKFTKIPDGDLTFFIFIFFIKNGLRPWWLNNQVRHFREFAHQAFLLQPQKFVSYFKFFIKHPTYRKRILDHLPEDLLVGVLIKEKKIDRIISPEAVFAIKDFLKKKYRYWNESKISQAFKEIILRLFLYGHPIDQAWKLNLAILTTLESLYPQGLKWSGLPGIWHHTAVQQSENQMEGKGFAQGEKGRSLPANRNRAEEYIQWFQFYLESGNSHPDIKSKNYNYREINYLFRYLISNQLDRVTSLLLSLGKGDAIKKRFLESISQELLDQFFSLIAPSKRKLMEWIFDVYQKVQEDYRPINQTLINVKKSINEITFELFLENKLNQINDENYLRYLFKQSSKKFGVKYKDLLFFTIKSLASGDKKYRVYKFFEILSSIYAKDILSGKPYFSVARSVIDWSHPDQIHGVGDYRSKKFIYDLFLSVYKFKQSGNVRLAGDWLETKLESHAIINTEDVLRLWEVFAAKFDLQPEQVLIPILVEKHKNSSIRLSRQAFNFWKNKYKLQGLHSRKKPEESLLIQTLQQYKNTIPRDTMRSILIGMTWDTQLEKLDFQRIASLIQPIDAQLVEGYLTWVNKLLIERQLVSKKSKVSNWFLHQLILQPYKNLKLEFLQRKTLEFLQSGDKLFGERMGKANTKSPEKAGIKIKGIGGRSANVSEYPAMQSKKYTQHALRLFEILGRGAILKIFPESKKYGDKILLQLMITKYEAEFFKLLKRHQFNEELQDYLLIQAPGWLKKQVLDFLFREALNPWGVTVSSLQGYFEKTKWIQLSGSSLLSFIETQLWVELFESTSISFGELAAKQLQNALAEGLITKVFWSDLSDFRSLEKGHLLPGKSHADHDLQILSDTDFIAYADVIRSRQLKGRTSASQILESILFDHEFPKGHPFEEYQVEDFRSYIHDLLQVDKKVLLGLLEKTESPQILHRFLRLLDVKHLRMLIQEQHRRLGLPNILKQLDAVFSYFKIKGKSKITDFLVAWIETLYFRKPEKSTPSRLFAVVFSVMIEEGILSMESLILGADWKPLLSILQMDSRTGDLFLEELVRQVGDQREAQIIAPTEPVFPEISQMENFKSYFQGPGQVDRKVLLGILKQVQSPALLQRMLRLLDTSMLRFLVQEHHRQLGLPNILRQLDGIFSFYKIKEESRITDFLVAWIGLLNFGKSDKGNPITSYITIFQVLLGEGVLSIASLDSVNDYKSLGSILQLEGREDALFVEQFNRMTGAGRSREIQSAPRVLADLLRIEDFEFFMQGSKPVDRKILTEQLLSRVKSPALTLRILKTLDGSTLRFLIEQQLRKLGLPNYVKQLEEVLDFFKVSEETSINEFLSAWIGMLYFRKVNLSSLSAFYVAVFRLVLTEGIIPTASFLSVSDLKPLLKIISLPEKEEVILLQELSKLSKTLVSIPEIESNQFAANDSFRGKNPIDLIYFPNELSLPEYVSLIESLWQRGFFNKLHWGYLQEWLRFAAKFESKEYLQPVFQIYFLKNLKTTADLRILKAQLFYFFLEKLKSDRKGLRLFISRLPLSPSLIQGIRWIALDGLSKEVSENWWKIWSQVNGSAILNQETDEREELIFSLFLRSGKLFYENKSQFQVSLEQVSKRLKLIPLAEIFSLNAPTEVFVELVKVKSSVEIQEYFVKGMDPNLKTLTGAKFLLDWFEEFFKSANEELLAKFLQLFQKSFYSNSFTGSQRIKFFLKGFYQLEWSPKAFRKVIEKEPLEMKSFFGTSPEFFESLVPRSAESIPELTALEAFQWYLDFGLLPKGISGLQQLAKLLLALKGSDLDRLRVFIHAGIQSEKSRQNFYKLLAYVEEAWFFGLIHGDLLDDLDELNKTIKGRVRADFFVDLGIGRKLDRMILISSQWERLSVKVKSPIEVLLLLVEKWTERVDYELVSEVFSGESLKSGLLNQLKISSKKLKKIVDQENEEEESKKPIPEEIEPIDYGEGVSISNAGLILLWPFYGRFFNALGMVGREGMKGEEIRERAIQLLEYIATGQSEFEEWDLTLNKILCGANPDFPVSPRIELSTEERELCDKLIKGTVYNWEKMRGTRMETFRETFIQRDGRLYQKEGRWELIVDNKAYDVLLDTLTWNISMINLSWMNTRITVQWR